METLATHGDVQAVKYDNNGAHHLYEVDPDTGKKTHLSSDNYLESMGFEPTPAEYANQSVQATIENTAPTQIPVVDAAETDPAAPIAEGNAVAREIGVQMNGETDDLVRRLDEMLPTVERTIEQRFDDLRREMDARFTELSQQFANLTTANDGNTRVQPPTETEPAGEPEPPAATPRGEAPAANTPELGNRMGAPGQAEIRGQTADGTPFIYRRGENGEWEVSRNGNLANEWWPATTADIARDLGLGDLAPQEPATVEPTPDQEPQPTEPAAEAVVDEDGATVANETVEDNSLRGRMRRAWNRMGNIASGRSILAAVNGRDAERIERTTSDRGRRRAVLGFLGAGIILGALAEDYLEGRHGIPKTGIPQHIREHAGGVLGPASLSHVEHFRGSMGHNRTGVELSGALHLKHLTTHDIIVDNQGHTIVGQLKEGIGDKQGNLSRAAKELLRSKGYKITQNGFEGSDGVFRYMSEVA